MLHPEGWEAGTLVAAVLGGEEGEGRQVGVAWGEGTAGPAVTDQAAAAGIQDPAGHPGQEPADPAGGSACWCHSQEGQEGEGEQEGGQGGAVQEEGPPAEAAVYCVVYCQGILTVQMKS